MQRIQPCWWLLFDRVKGYHLEMFITNRTTDLYYLNVNWSRKITILVLAEQQTTTIDAILPLPRVALIVNCDLEEVYRSQMSLLLHRDHNSS